MEAVQAFGQFVTTWSVFKWWGIKKEKGKKAKAPAGTLSTGIKNGLIYHSGSILKAAASVPQWRPWRLIYWVTAEISDGKAPTTALGKVIEFVSSFTCGCFGLQGCCGLKDMSQEMIRRDDCAVKDGFNDVAIRSNDFGPGVSKAHALLEHSHKIVQFLYRDLAMSTLSVIGVCSISSLSTAFVYFMVANLDIYCDPISPLFVADPVLVTFLCWILSAYIAFGYMTIWEHSCDCLLYCYCWHRQWSRKTVLEHIPDNLRYIVGFDDTQDDRYPYYGKAANNMYLRTWMPMVAGAPAPKGVAAATKAQQATMKSQKANATSSFMPQGMNMGMYVDPHPHGEEGLGYGMDSWARQEASASAPGWAP
jgi:hypothetical protein